MPKSQAKIEELPGKGDDGNGKEKKPSGGTRKRSGGSDTQLRGRLAGCFERIAQVLRERGDEELAGIIEEDGPTIAQGLVSLTRPFAALRMVVLAVVAIIEPALAFGRVVRVLAGRWADRRARIQYERETAAEEAAGAATG